MRCKEEDLLRKESEQRIREQIIKEQERIRQKQESIEYKRYYIYHNTESIYATCPVTIDDQFYKMIKEEQEKVRIIQVKPKLRIQR